VTGGAGFIGSHVVEHLISKGNEVVVIDNLSSGNYDSIKEFVESGSVRFVRADLKILDDSLVSEFKDVDAVIHLAANPEVRVSTTHPRIHFNENVVATFNVLEACRLSNVKLVVFASSSTVYGDAKTLPTPEDYTPLEPISVYGASKLASEYLLITYSKLYGIKSLILRLANIVGPRQTHGVVVDFIRKLRRDPTKLEILGDGRQRKSYLHISDLLRALDVTMDYISSSGRCYDILNVGNRDWVEVDDIARIVIDELGLKDVKLIYVKATPDGRGWQGDVKFMLLDITKLVNLGWRPSMTSEEAVRDAVKSLIATGMF